MNRIPPSRFSTLPTVLVLAWVSACGTGYPIGAEHAKPIVRIDAEKDLDCPPDEITLKEEWGGVWRAVGCGRVQRYNTNCSGIRCDVHRAEEGPVPIQDRPAQ